MYTLDTFYNSKEWRNILKLIKNNRTDSNGNIICEHCGKPIVKAYDIIGHHKIELTEYNVNDYDVALNEDNIMLIHLRCHNDIHHRLDRNHRNVYIVYGAPCSGKHTYVNNIMNVGDLIVDVDRIWQCVSGYDSNTKPNKLKQIVFSVRDCLIDSVRYRLGYWNNAYIIGGYPLCSERERLAKDLRAKEIFINTTKEECIDRLNVNTNITNKDEWLGYISSWFDLYS